MKDLCVLADIAISEVSDSSIYKVSFGLYQQMCEEDVSEIQCSSLSLSSNTTERSCWKLWIYHEYVHEKKGKYKL